MGVINFVSKYGYKIFERPYELNIIGHRTTDRATNTFDDYLYVFYKDDRNNWIYHTWKVTTDPGTKALKLPVNSKGTAILVPGQYTDCYQIGLHKGKYEALVQRLPVKVYRDNNLDTILDANPETINKGIFGINIHKAGLDSVSVDGWSYGCNVFKRAKDFNEFLLLAKKHQKLYGNTFTYTLINE